MRRTLPIMLAAVLGLGAAGLSACGDRSHLIPLTDANELSDQLDAVDAAVADGKCRSAANAVVRARRVVARMRRDGVDRKLVNRMEAGVANLRVVAGEECSAARTTTTQTDTTPTDTTPTDTTPTDTTTTDTTTVPTTTTPTTTTPTTTTPTTDTSTQPLQPDPSTTSTGATP